VYTPWRESDGSVSGWVASVTDITARKQAEAALQSAYNELAQSNAALQAKEIERRALLRQLVTVQENERQRLSRELHDQTGQHLAALRMMLSILNEPLQTQPEQFQVFTQIRQLTDKLGQDLHTLAWELRPTRLQEAGLAVALAQYVQECSARTSIAMDFHFKGDEQRRFPVLHEIITYRVVQEALTNVLKYAQAQQVSVVLEYFPDRLRAIVEDDGVGFAPEKLGTSDDGLGLRGMRERAALADGKLEIESSIGYGTTIYLTLPLTENDRPEGVV
ncbi:MAG TPA: histidine kinase, partial [Blastocatellia bacterium]|nr:histidine kinase [Blastocatellia bacterium]